MSVFVCIRLYFDYMCLYLFVFVYICLYLYVSDHCVSVQHGLMPLTTADYRHFPFTHNADRKQWNGAVTFRTESFHNAVGNLRCFDATQSKDDKKPHFNWWDRDNTFIAGVKRAPPYTALFWEMFFKVAANLGDASKDILEANSPEAIDALRARKVKVVTHDGSAFITEEIRLISDNIRAMVDNICFMGVYGHRSLFEKLSANRRAAFNEFTLKIARENEDKFYESWKSYRAAHPAEAAEGGNDDNSDTERLISVLLGDDDEAAEVDGAAAAGAGAAAGGV